ncbi:hypothetical protein [Burkholderia ubonensis]|uniref:hypothetical protein n=1 Tax=Burkholderia ubonensis TaxID=101571 RepID=UPI0012FA081A|nr:hypothetical protein [Burkholderia ubonensis]
MFVWGLKACPDQAPGKFYRNMVTFIFHEIKYRRHLSHGKTLPPCHARNPEWRDAAVAYGKRMRALPGGVPIAGTPFFSFIDKLA